MRLFMLFIFCCCCSLFTEAQQLAFPWAEGHGRFTSGGRGHGVFFVTNLNNSGSGSFRQALADAQSAGGGNIIFRTGGTIEITSNLTFWSNISVWGMSAPGDGICIYGDNSEARGENLIITDLRFRPGDPNASGGDDAFRIQNQSVTGSFSNYMFDHCSFSWASDENFSIGTGTSGNCSVSDVTLQNCIFSESFDARNILLWGKNITNISILKNYLANTQQRNIRVSTTPNVSFEQTNNYIYGTGFGINPTNKNIVDAINNVFEDGFATMETNAISFNTCSADNCPPSGDTSFTGTALYHSGNTKNGNAITVSSNVNSYITGSPNVSSGYAHMPTNQVKAHVLANAGARAWSAEGVDALDAHVIADGLNGSSGNWPSNESQTTGLPTLAVGTPYVDTDNDGMADDWEMARWGTLANSYNGDDDDDGYTNLEEFMHYLVGQGDEGPDPEPPTPTAGKMISTRRLMFFN